MAIRKHGCGAILGRSESTMLESTSTQEIWKQAVAAFERGAHSLLERRCRDYLEHAPDNFPARMLLAHALLKMKRFEASAELLEGADPEDERALVLWHRTAGDYYFERGDYEAAEDEYASALSLVEHQTSDLVLDLVDAMLGQGRSQAALDALDAFEAQLERTESDEDQELLVLAKARTLRNLGRYADSLELARQALALAGGELPEAESLLGELEDTLADSN
ncbi:hypothetical protein G6O69_30935 [Pseudenhygromyxa sp. WMMC2535]|uniref:tetratricopeptide repeat protein n=1 Tax=Pseudenhygromyxa sp. WMMC2535 TaxID=2712867 RepID=UPI001554477A|nr:tetratricopeptide repeat protein [Pseudenhygromyxa sp. WMMC2535]NVB42280.1 hypothetical protein [Pseudenhygromyxa sp. WMMC2535]